MNLLRTLALCVATATAAAVVSADDRVLVLSSQKQLLHATGGSSSSSSGFNAAGLAELAMDALGLGSSSVASPSARAAAAAARSPLQADVFSPAQAYALVLVQDEGALADSIAAATTSPADAFARVFPASFAAGAAQAVPPTIAREFAAAFGDESVACAGSAALCSQAPLKRVRAASDATVRGVLATHSFLRAEEPADAALAQELAQVQELSASLAGSPKRALFVVGLSDVQALALDKRERARRAVADELGAFLSALQAARASSGAQVVAARARASAAPLTQLSDAATYGRLLVSLATPAPASGSDDDDDDDDEDDDDSGSGDNSDDEVGATNATRAGNGTSAEKVTLEQIAEYQIVLWTSVLLVVVLLLVLLAMCNMNTGRDSLLYAKFITDAAHRKGD